MTTTHARPYRSCQVFSDGLQVEHQVGICADELPDFIDKEYEAVLRLSSPGIP